MGTVVERSPDVAQSLTDGVLASRLCLLSKLGIRLGSVMAGAVLSPEVAHLVLPLTIWKPLMHTISLVISDIFRADRVLTT